MSSPYKSLEFFEKGWFGLNDESCCSSVSNWPLIWVSYDFFFFLRWHVLEKKEERVGQCIGLWATIANDIKILEMSEEIVWED